MALIDVGFAVVSAALLCSQGPRRRRGHRALRHPGRDRRLAEDDVFRPYQRSF